MTNTIKTMLLITNGKILCPDKIIENEDIFIEDNSITEIGPNLGKKYPDARVLDAGGGVVMPGFINCHMHLYSTFARGMTIPGNAPRNFLEILGNLWWRLDKVLTEEDVYYSALIPLIESIKCGTTTIIDHHASPNFVSGSLETIERALKQIPVRASLCYEVSDRDGEEIAIKGIDENARFIEKHLGNEMLTGMFGLHASFTISEKTLKSCVKVAKELNCGFHVHTAEDAADVEDCRKKYGMGVVERFEKENILGSQTLLAHCVHISDKEMDILAKTKTNVAHNPSSNMNNAVGAAKVLKMLNKGVMVGLGTDGMSSDMLAEARFAHLLMKHTKNDPRFGFSETGKMLFENNHKIIDNLFKSKLGKIKKGALADIIIMDYLPPSPLTKENFLGHFLYGMTSANVSATIVNGKILMENKKLIGLDEEAIFARARELSLKLWHRINI